MTRLEEPIICQYQHIRLTLPQLHQKIFILPSTQPNSNQEQPRFGLTTGTKCARNLVSSESKLLMHFISIRKHIYQNLNHELLLTRTCAISFLSSNMTSQKLEENFTILHRTSNGKQHIPPSNDTRNYQSDRSVQLLIIRNCITAPLNSKDMCHIW